MNRWFQYDGKIKEDYNRCFHINKILSGSTSGTTIYTAPSDKRYVITDIAVSAGNDNEINIFDDINTEGNNIMDIIVSTSGGNSTFFNHTFATPYFSHSLGSTVKVSTTTSAKTYLILTGFLIDF